MQAGFQVETRWEPPRAGLTEWQPGQQKGEGLAHQQAQCAQCVPEHSVEGTAVHPCKQGGGGPRAPPLASVCRGCASAFLKPKILPLGLQFALQLVLTAAIYCSSALNRSTVSTQLVPR